MPGQTEPSPHVLNCEHQPSLVEAGKRAWVNVDCGVPYEVQSPAVVEGTSMRTVQLVLQPSCLSLAWEGTALRLLSGEVQGTRHCKEPSLEHPEGSFLQPPPHPPKAAEALCEALQKADNWPPLLYCRTSSDCQAGEAKTSRGSLPGP